MASKGLTTAQKECVFFWVDNMDKDIKPPKIVKFLQRELSVSCQVVLFPNLFLDNTCSGAIYVQSKEHARRVLKLLKDPNNIIVSLKGRYKNCLNTLNITNYFLLHLAIYPFGFLEKRKYMLVFYR